VVLQARKGNYAAVRHDGGPQRTPGGARCVSGRGRAAYEARPDPESIGHTSERGHTELDDKRLRAFQRKTTAWKFFEAQPPGYRTMVITWIMSAKKNETKDRRLKALVESSPPKKRLF